jgi:hypothetical protein
VSRETPESQSGSPATSLSSTTERAFLRLSFWQTILSLIGVFVGAVALYAALTESEAVREQTEASVWPYVQFTIFDNISPESAHFRLELSNVGVGPGRMRSMRVAWDGQALPDWDAVVHQVLPAAELGVDYGKADASKRVLAPGESHEMFATTNPALVQALQAAVGSGRATIEYCYCSIFNTCWIADSRSAQNDPLAVDACPEFAGEAFRN